ncbi:transcriptional regulator [Pseudoclavibacter endophyticus]|uniref:Helix-turn-helix transcriptional regulator n=1 Tax=Pseudoclavibacter endophyticus TaxID=1778590 RepID=A0A6H9WP53_9MICO|nr:metalloregulator ArsR/SmtB family transcription factor [Pseudoclavibacter endophyticus]KAB1649501.1 helix-turn-helix transcriptional regulator [Pseudoclavibacter endophyticus]GGA62105.1 transcriptional regulator [Pseudoclavibacter endophyticus]
MSTYWDARPLYEVKAGLFQGLSHPFRIRVLELLADGTEHSVSELLGAMDLEASHLSQHLAVLRRNRLVVSNRRGSHVYYRLFSPTVASLLAVARHLLGELTTADAARVGDITSLPELPGGPAPRESDDGDDGHSPAHREPAS